MKGIKSKDSVLYWKEGYFLPRSQEFQISVVEMCAINFLPLQTRGGLDHVHA